MPDNMLEVLKFISEKLGNLFLGSKCFKNELWKWFPYSYIFTKERKASKGDVQGPSPLLPS